MKYMTPVMNEDFGFFLCPRRMSTCGRVCVIVECEDPSTEISKEYIMHFDPDDTSVEVVDRVTKKCTHSSDSCTCLL